MVQPDVVEWQGLWSKNRMSCSKLAHNKEDSAGVQVPGYKSFKIRTTPLESDGIGLLLK